MNGRKGFDQELEELSAALIRMGVAATDAIDKVITALTENDRELARHIIENDDVIDEMERNIEQRCLRLLLKQQPVAGDLRKISAAIKMITDIERIGDAASDIAEISIHLQEPVFPQLYSDIKAMALVSRGMASDAIDAYVGEDLELARAVIERDDVVDQYFLDIRGELGIILSKGTGYLDEAMDYLMIIKYLERIGDHAVNIGEWVEFYKTGVHKRDKII